MAPRKNAKESVGGTSRNPKRRKTAETENQPKKHRGNRGKLALMLTMPVEVFIEIARHLSPLDILRMARCSRDLHAMLMSKSSKSIWIAARANMEIPDCPREWSEPEYASFLFEAECDSCGTRTPSVNYFLMVRLCKSCSDLLIGRGRDIALDHFGKISHPNGDIPVHEDSTIYKLAPYDAAFEDILDTLPHLPPGALGDLHPVRMFLRDQFVEAVYEYLTVDDSERAKFVEGREAEVKEMVEHGRLLQKWADNRAKIKEREKVQLKLQREKDVRRRLIQEGYPEDQLELFSNYSVDWLKLVRDGKPLTDRTWKTFFPKVKTFMSAKLETMQQIDREQRLERRGEELRRQYWDYLKSLSPEDRIFQPSVNDIVNAPFFEQLLHRDDFRVEVTKEEWEKTFRPSMESFALDYEESTRHLLQKMIDEAKKIIVSMPAEQRLTPILVDEVLEDLTLDGPTTFLTQYSNAIVQTIPMALDETRRCSIVRYNGENGMDRYITTRVHLEPCTVEPQLACIASILLRSLGMSDKSMEEMEALGSSLVCMSCSQEQRRRRSWLELVRHVYMEKDWFQTASAKLDPNDVVDTHRFAAGQEVARIDASFPSGICTDEAHQHMDEEPLRYYCRTCGADGLFYSTRYMTCARTHFRVKHGREPVEADIIDMDF